MKRVTAATKEKVLNWMFECENTGMSSEALAYFLATGDKSRHGLSYPRDPSDFNRCMIMLEWVPELKERLPLIAKECPIWAELVKNWEWLEITVKAEFETGRAPISYKAMKAMGC